MFLDADGSAHLHIEGIIKADAYAAVYGWMDAATVEGFKFPG